MFLTTRELSARWRVPVSTIWRWAELDRIPSIRLGRLVRFRLADIEAWEAAGGEKGRTTSAARAAAKAQQSTAPPAP